MIRTSRQLKALIRNMTKGDSVQAQILIRNYVMERFLERVSLSKYKNYFILKGGMLVSVMVGISSRSTLDIDTTIKNLSLSVETARKIIEEIMEFPIDDGMSFEIKNVTEIIEESEYPGIRVSMDAKLEMMKIPLKIDISTNDVITPEEVLYSFKLMFEERSISILAYNLETVLAEKLETVITRATANTRLRDYYDLYILQKEYSNAINWFHFNEAFKATCKKRHSDSIVKDATKIIRDISEDDMMKQLWSSYQKKYNYAEDIAWETVIDAIDTLFSYVS